MNNFLKKQQELSVSKDNVGFAWTGQAGYAFKDGAGLVYCVDPYLSDVCSRFVGYHRMVPPPVEANQLIADFILFTHEHRDHLDPESVPVIADANPSAIFAGPPSCISILLELGISAKRLISIKRGEEKKVGNIAVAGVLANHTDDSVGYILKFGTIHVYITGDTTYSDELIPVEKFNPEIMMTCINGRLGCMNIPDAARLTCHIQPKIAIPMHYGMFQENTANPKEFVRQVEAYSGITKGFIMEHGTWYLYERREAEVKNMD